MTGMDVGIQKSTTARQIQQTVMQLMRKPQRRPSEKDESRTARRPRSMEIRMGRPYEVDRQMVATPVNELNAALDPK